MIGKPNPLEILLELRREIAPSIPEDVVQQILEIEHRAQFSQNRVTAQSSIKSALTALLAKEELQS